MLLMQMQDEGDHIDRQQHLEEKNTPEDEEEPVHEQNEQASQRKEADEGDADGIWDIHEAKGDSGLVTSQPQEFVPTDRETKQTEKQQAAQRKEVKQQLQPSSAWVKTANRPLSLREIQEQEQKVMLRILLLILLNRAFPDCTDYYIKSKY